MLKRLFKSKKAQNTAEYAILISLVVAGIVAMQTYAQRALQARVKDSSGMLSSVDGGADAGFSTGGGKMTGDGWHLATSAQLSNVAQYEPYYLKQSYDINRTDTETKRLDNGFSGTSDSKRTRGKGGYQSTGWGTDGSHDYDYGDEKYK